MGPGMAGAEPGGRCMAGLFEEQQRPVWPRAGKCKEVREATWPGPKDPCRL